jgi:uncharacterized protein (TIGR02996 family)
VTTLPTNAELMRRAVLEHPDDDTVRLAYADALDEEAGRETNLGAFIRAQIQGPPHGYDWRHLKHTAAPFLDYEDAQDLIEVSCFVRGFIHKLHWPVETFLKHADALLWSPSETKECAGCADCFDQYPIVGKSKCPISGRTIPVVDKTRGKHRVPRPCPPTAHPIEEVTLTGEVSNASLIEGAYPWDRPSWLGEYWYVPFVRRWPKVRWHSPGLISSPAGTCVVQISSGNRFIEADDVFRPGDRVYSDANGRAVKSGGSAIPIGVCVAFEKPK